MGFIGILQVPMGDCLVGGLVPAWSGSGHVRCVASLSLSCLEFGGALESFARMMSQTRISSRY